MVRLGGNTQSRGGQASEPPDAGVVIKVKSTTKEGDQTDLKQWCIIIRVDILQDTHVGGALLDKL